MNKKYDLAVVVGEYQNQQGETKKQYKNIGAVIQNDNGFYMLLDRTFNAAGLPNPDNRSNCIVSMFEPRDKKPQQNNTQQNTQQNAPQQNNNDNYEEDIPF